VVVAFGSITVAEPSSRCLEWLLARRTCPDFVGGLVARPGLPCTRWCLVALAMMAPGCTGDGSCTPSRSTQLEADPSPTMTSPALRRPHRFLDPPEARFLAGAADQMRRKHEELAVFPNTWRTLFDCGEDWRHAYFGATADGFSAPDSEQWTPRVSAAGHRFVIMEASASTFRIEAVDRRNRVTWFIDQTDAAPTQLLPVYCERERSGEGPEPVRFLRYAASELQTHVSPFPTSWADITRLHWSNKGHLRDDVATKPSPAAGRRWQPNGSDYTYELTTNRGARTFMVRSHNQRGLPNYAATHAAPEPVPIEP